MFSALEREPKSIADLNHKTVSIATQGSGSYQLNQAILSMSGLDPKQSNFVHLNSDDAFAALKAGQIDAMMLVLAPEAPLAQRMFSDQSIGLMSIASVAELVARKDLNPATIYLLMSISKKYFSKPGILNAENEFPSNAGLSFSLNEDADNYLKSGPSFLFQYLPFWVAVWVERMLKLSLPLMALLFPLFNVIPSLTDYRKKLKFANIYRDLKMIEQGMSGHQDREKLSKQLGDIDQRAKELKVSDFHTKDIYDLRMHIESVKKRLMTSS